MIGGYGKIYFLLLCLCLANSVVHGRRLGRRRLRERQRLESVSPLIRSLDKDSDVTAPSAPTAPTDAMSESQSPSQRLLLIKPTAGEARDSSRTFKHLLMMKSLLGNSAFAGGGSSAGNYVLPYIIINTPTNVTNVNDNQLLNTPTTGTTTGTGTATTGNRRRRVWVNRAQTIPVAVPVQMPVPTAQHVPTQVVHQRESGLPQVKGANRTPAMMLALNDQLIPIFAPAQLQNAWRRGDGGSSGGGLGNLKRRRIVYNDKNSANFNNPFAVLANSLRRVQHL